MKFSFLFVLVVSLPSLDRDPGPSNYGRAMEAGFIVQRLGENSNLRGALGHRSTQG
jgi:hypothetical protein